MLGYKIMAHRMTKNISLKIRELSGLTLTKFAKTHNIDYPSLKSFISGNCTGEKKSSKAYKVKKKLLELKIITNKEVEAAAEKTATLQKKIQKDKLDRRKIIARLRRKKKQSIQEYVATNIEYFNKHEININLFRSFISGIGTGIREGSKSYMIRKLLERDELLAPFSSEKQDEIEAA